MLKFLKLIDAVKTHKQFSGNMLLLTLSYNQCCTEIETKLDQCVPFVFYKTSTHEAEENREDLLDAPFAVFSIELLNGNIPIIIQPDFRIEASCIFVFEVAPKLFNYAALLNRIDIDHEGENQNVTGFLQYIRYDDRLTSYQTDDVVGSIHDAVSHFINTINTGQIGLEKVRERIKIGTGATKRTHTFRQVTHVRPKKDKTVTTLNNRNVDWSTQWLVRGHWRKHEGIGKDRAGNRCTTGHTWVTEHCKGSDGAPLIKKIRVVHTEG